MKYKIKEIMPSQILVEFEDESKAMVYINPEASPEDIDDAVSYFDPEYFPDPETLINKNVVVGEERVSTRKENSPGPAHTVTETVPCDRDPEDVPDVELTPLVTELYGGLPLPTFHKDQIIISYVMSDYYIKHHNDYRLKEMLDEKIEEYIITNNITVEKAIESLLFSNDDLIVHLAEKELENEQQ